MIKKGLAVIVLLLAPLAACSQNAVIDSLNKIVRTTKVDSSRGRALCALCGAYRDISDQASSFKHGEEGLAECKRSKDLIGEASCQTSIGRTYFEMGEFAQALERFQRTLAINERLENDRGVANARANMGNALYYLGKYREALEQHGKALEGGQAVGDFMIVRMGLNGMGASYLAQGNIPKALESFQDAVRIQEKMGGSDLQMASAMQNVCALHLMMDEYAKSLECYRKCRQTFKKHNSKDQEAVTLNNMGGCFEKLGDLGQAQEHYQQSLDIRQQIGDQQGMSSSLSNLGNILALRGKYAEAMEFHVKSLAIDEKIGNQAGVASGLTNISSLQLRIGMKGAAQESARKALEKAEAIGNVEYLRAAANALYQADSTLGNWKSAFEAHRLYKIYSDSLKNDDQSKELGRLESKYEFEKAAEEEKRREEEQARIEAERTERRNSLQYLSIFAALIALFGALVFLGRFSVSVRVMDVALFAGLLILFEFLLVLFDPFVDRISAGVPLYKLAFNTGIAVVLAPLHHFSTRALRRRLVKKGVAPETEPPPASPAE